MSKLQGGWGGWPTGNGKKLSNSQACCLSQQCLAAAKFLSISCGPSTPSALYSVIHESMTLVARFCNVFWAAIQYLLASLWNCQENLLQNLVTEVMNDAEPSAQLGLPNLGGD